MLIICPECGLKISDKAISCPHCGYPLKSDPNHRPHDARKTFVTRAKEYNLDEYAIKYIVGHAIEDITERVYTKRNIEWLKNEIEKIK